MRNVWEAGQDALLKALAERDARKRLDEDRARQAVLDEERRQQILAQQELQRGQLKSIDEDRDERRRLAAEAAEASGTNALLKDETTRRGEAGKQTAIQAYKEALASGDENDVKGAIADLAVHGIRVQAPVADRLQPVSPGATLYNPKTKKAEFTAPNRPPMPGKGPTVPRSERELPQGVTDWLDTLTQYPTFAEAQKVFDEGFAQQRKHHPEVDRQKALMYLQRDFPFGQSRDETGGKARAAAVVQRGAAAPSAETVTSNAVPGTAPKVTPIYRPIPGLPGESAVSFDGGKTWNRVVK